MELVTTSTRASSFNRVEQSCVEIFPLAFSIASRVAFPNAAAMRLFIFILALGSASLAADMREDWAQILALDAGPKEQPKTQDEALQVSLTHLEECSKPTPHVQTSGYVGIAHIN